MVGGTRGGGGGSETQSADTQKVEYGFSGLRDQAAWVSGDNEGLGPLGVVVLHPETRNPRP